MGGCLFAGAGRVLVLFSGTPQPPHLELAESLTVTLNSKVPATYLHVLVRGFAWDGAWRFGSSCKNIVAVCSPTFAWCIMIHLGSGALESSWKAVKWDPDIRNMINCLKRSPQIWEVARSWGQTPQKSQASRTLRKLRNRQNKVSQQLGPTTHAVVSTFLVPTSVPLFLEIAET